MGNLRQQLIKDKICARLEDTKPWIRQHCRVQFLVIENAKERTIAEHLVLAVLQPDMRMKGPGMRDPGIWSIRDSH